MSVDSSYYAAPQRARATRRLDEREPFFLSEELENDPSPLVMVIDDSYVVRRVVELSMQRAGIPAVAFADGFEALAALREQRIAPPRVLLLDISMPRLNGYEVVKQMRSRPEFAQTQIIMLSGFDGIVNQVKARMIGANGFIAKPFKSLELIERVREALGLLDVSEW